ncbi:hypothetical protein TGAMA5MH_02220 [Trichoderma gamsii]|uniref:Uncharacterized protein n=1 Tax=Trichoderma gamsii TaxID=398673 RepID=A0A2K0TKX9_9HYPO|nr:hypothetical protein TGAMA5MH_02220 [Trichoderma gamsii]
MLGTLSRNQRRRLGRMGLSIRAPPIAPDTALTAPTELTDPVTAPTAPVTATARLSLLMRPLLPARRARPLIWEDMDMEMVSYNIQFFTNNSDAAVRLLHAFKGVISSGPEGQAGAGGGGGGRPPPRPPKRVGGCASSGGKKITKRLEVTGRGPGGTLSRGEIRRLRRAGVSRDVIATMATTMAAASVPPTPASVPLAPAPALSALLRLRRL